MTTLYIMHGLPGSGKSTKCQELQKKLMFWLCLSTDNYWIRPDGYYDFNPKRIKEAHEWTFKHYMQEVQEDLTDTIIDNTNLSLADCRKYLDNWPAYGKIEIVEPDTVWRYDVAECAKRTTHSVPIERIQAMRDKQICGREEILKYIENRGNPA